MLQRQADARNLVRQELRKKYQREFMAALAARGRHALARVFPLNPDKDGGRRQIPKAEVVRPWVKQGFSFATAKLVQNESTER